MEHMESIIEDLVGRLAALEDRDNIEDTKTSRNTRSKSSTDPAIEEKLKNLARTQKTLEERLEEIEAIVEQLNDPST
jgi:ABC-type transporter Mla subunit MlaD